MIDENSIVVSIVTVVFNGENHIEGTIRSVLSQTYPNVEYVIVDGGSTDRTLTILDKYRKNIDVIVSEKDGGIYDAMNKGIALSSGELIGMVNADDWYESNAVEDIVNAYLSQGHPDVIYGYMRYHHLELNQYRIIKPSLSKMNYDMTLNHPSFFVKRDVYKSKQYDLAYAICADYEFALYLLKNKGRFHEVKSVITNMRNGGASGNYMACTNEVFNIQSRYFGITAAGLTYLKRVIKRSVLVIMAYVISEKRVNRILGFTDKM